MAAIKYWIDSESQKQLILLIMEDEITICGPRSVLPSLGRKMQEMQELSGYAKMVDASSPEYWHFIIRPAHNWSCVETDIVGHLARWMGRHNDEFYYIH